MSLENYSMVFAEKSRDDIAKILNDMRLFSLTGEHLYVTLLCVIGVGILVFLFDKRRMKAYGFELIRLTALYLIYMVGMTFMYIFSMSKVEASVLASAERYRATILVTVYFILMIWMVQLISCANGVTRHQLAAALTSFILLMISKGYITDGRTSFNSYSESVSRKWIDKAIDENDVPEYSTYYLLMDMNDFDYWMSYWSARYITLSPSIGIANHITDMSQVGDILNYHYVLIQDAGNPVIQDWISEYYPDQVGKTAIRIQ